MQAVGKTGGQYLAYSDRFSYSGMTGSFPDDPALKAGLADISGTTGPDNVDKTVKSGGNTAVVPGQEEYAVAYTMQTGPTRYAPMQPVPATKITKGKPAKPLNPTSSVPIAKTKLPIPKVKTTLTQSQTFSIKSRENTVRLTRWQTFLICTCCNMLTPRLGRCSSSRDRRHGQISQPLEGLDVLYHCQASRAF
jgi:hypothetical protein